MGNQKLKERLNKLKVMSTYDLQVFKQRVQTRYINYNYPDIARAWLDELIILIEKEIDSNVEVK